MKKFPRILITSAIIFSLLAPTYSADHDDYEDKPHRVSMCSIFKTALVGLGLLTAPQPVQGDSPSSLLGCYIGTVDPKSMINTNTISINKMLESPCNYYYDYPLNEYNNISMIMNATCSSSGSTNIYSYCQGVTIDHITLCSQSYSLVQNGTTYPGYSAYLDWNPRENNKYEEFALCIKSFSGGITNDASQFATAFNQVMSTGSCPPTPQPASRRLLEKRDEESIRH